MLAGIVYYRRQGKTLVGKWTHQKIGGVLADEVVHDVAMDATEGDWPVDIMDLEGRMMFQGRLRAAKLGDALELIWTGKFTKDDTEGRFEGIGVAITHDMLVATFEQISPL